MSLTRRSRCLKLNPKAVDRECLDSQPSRHRLAHHCEIEQLELRTLLCGSSNNLTNALPISVAEEIADRIDLPGEVDVFKFALAEPGRLTVRTQSEPRSSLDSRTGLMAAEGRLLIQSDGESASPDDIIVQHLLAGTYHIAVEGLGGTTGGYTLATEFEPASPPSQSLQVNFDRDYPFGLSPWFNAIGDFNGDKHPDIATANLLTNDVSVLLGLGDGTFHSAGNFGVGPYPMGIVAGDFNHDGLLDLAVANQFSDDVSVLMGVGDGTFSEETRFTAGTMPSGITTADLDTDGWLDLIVTGIRSNDVSVLMGNGDGSFREASRFATGEDPFHVVTGDFNGDTFLDMATSNFEAGTITVLLGLGDGTFTVGVKRDWVTGGSPNIIATGDLNGDGRLDLVTADSGPNQVWVHMGNGDGTFQSPTAQGRLSVGASPIGVVVGDFNADGRADLATANRQSNDVSVMLGVGDGTFQMEQRYRVGLQPFFISAVDINGDGRVDLTSANSRSHDMSVLLGLGDGTFEEDLTDPRRGETNPQGTVLQDFNGDGILDLAAVSYTGHNLFIFLGRGDGTFRERVPYSVGSTPVGLVAEDFNEDGFTDLATANCDSGDTSILLGVGDGTFRDEVRWPASTSGEFILAGDFNGDGHADLIDSGQFASGIAIMLGRGDGTFKPPHVFGLADAPADGAAGDFNGDGHLDLAVTNHFSPDHDVSIYLGNGDGTFPDPLRVEVEAAPLGIAAADVDRNGTLDLAVANFGARSVSLLFGRGDGTFPVRSTVETEAGPDFLVLEDFNGDSNVDLAVSNARSTVVSVLLGQGGGVFADRASYATSGMPTPRRGLAAGDMNGDGRADLAVAQVLANDIAVLLGEGDGSFQLMLGHPVGFGPAAITTGDFNNDGRLDLGSVNPTTAEVTVSLGAGDATLPSSLRFRVGTAPAAIVHGDFNRDGRLDLATANYGSHDISVLLGLGDGKFQDEQRFAGGKFPAALAVGDFDGDFRDDLVIASVGSNDLSILRGHGDGTFGIIGTMAAQGLPEALIADDFNSDGRLDLAVANYQSADVAVLLGNGDGTFQDPIRIALNTAPVSLAAGDFNSDGHVDLATANNRTSDSSILLGRGTGSFLHPVRFRTGTGPVAIVVSDFNSDGRMDLATANSDSQDVTFLLGRGDGTFGDPLRLEVGDSPAALAAVDFSNDARTDLAIATQLRDDTVLFQGLGDGTIVTSGTLSNPRHATPLVADWNGDGLPDLAVVTREGRILLRARRPGSPESFDAPVLVDADPAFAARDLALLSTGGILSFASLDARRSALSLYSRQPDGTYLRTAGPTIPGTLPVSLASGDLNGDGNDDLVVAEAGHGELFVFLQLPAQGANRIASFNSAPDASIKVGASPSAIELADVNGDDRLDIVATNQFSGDVSVYLNDCDGSFDHELRYRTGIGLYSLVEHAGNLTVHSREAPAAVVAGQFDADGAVDLVVANSGSNSFSVLRGSRAGGFLNPAGASRHATGVRPTVVIADRFNRDPYLDLAILNEGSADLSIFLGDGQGGFTEQLVRALDDKLTRLSAGNLPTGLSTHDVNGDGELDLLVGNDFGDVLTLLGNGDGTFQPFQRAGQNIALAIGDLNGDDLDDFIFASESRDRVFVQYSLPGQTFSRERDDGIIAPGAVSLADLNHDQLPDLVVANGGSNNVLVYLGTGRGEFGSARSFFAGTSPAGVTIQDLNGDQLLDLVVANEGSNDVTVLLGQGRDSNWTLGSGPRLRAGAGPVATIVQDFTGDRIPDILVSNSQSDNLSLLPGVGRGFFDDRNPISRPVGREPGPIIAVGSGVIAVNRGSNDLTFIPDLFAPARFDFPSGGLRPVAAVAGDFTGDAVDDLIVANNGDGVVALLAGEGGEFVPARFYSLDEIRHPTSLVVSASGGDLEVYVAGEGHESAILLTSFGIPIPTPSDSETRPPLGDFVLVNGPGFAAALNILTTSISMGAPDEPLDTERGPSPLHTQTLVERISLSISLLMLSEFEDWIPNLHLDGVSVDEAAADEDASITTDLTGFMIGVDDALRHELAPSPAEDTLRATADAVLRAVDLVLSEWLPFVLSRLDEADRNWLLGVAEDLLSGDTGTPIMQPLRESVQRLASMLLRAVDTLLNVDRTAGDSSVPGDPENCQAPPEAAPSRPCTMETPVSQAYLDAGLGALLLVVCQSFETGQWAIVDGQAARSRTPGTKLAPKRRKSDQSRAR